MTAFRVHYADGKCLIVDAETPKEAATKAAKAGHIGIVTKIKIAKDVTSSQPCLSAFYPQ